MNRLAIEAITSEETNQKKPHRRKSSLTDFAKQLLGEEAQESEVIEVKFAQDTKNVSRADDSQYEDKDESSTPRKSIKFAEEWTSKVHVIPVEKLKEDKQEDSNNRVVEDNRNPFEFPKDDVQVKHIPK